MKVAIIGSNSFDSLEYHIKDELNVQGHKVEIFDYATWFIKKIDLGLNLISETYVEYQNKKLLKRVIDFNPDLVIGVYRHIHPYVVKKIKSEKIKIIHINPDQLSTLRNQQIFVEPYDAYFTKDPYMVKFMKEKLKLNVFLYQEAFNPRVHKFEAENYEDIENSVNIDVLCFGNLYPYRNRMLHLIKDNGCSLTLYGHKAKYFDTFLESNYKNKGIYGKEKAHILYGSKIVFNNLHYAEIESVNNKFFEINGTGAFQICDYKPILNDLLPIAPEKVSFKTIDEAISLMDYYLNQPEERWKLREQIHKHFVENYTYENMLKNVLKRI